MSETAQKSCCDKNFELKELWLLADIKGFTARKMYIGLCKICRNEIVILAEKRINDEKIFFDKKIGNKAVKTIYRERKRKVAAFPNIKSNGLYGWVFGVNVEIKNKKGDVTRIRQYSSDFKHNKTLVKTFKA